VTAQYEVEGLSRFVSTMRRAGAELQDFKDANARAGNVIIGAARSRVPFRSGALAGSMRTARQARRVVVMAGRASVPYAGPIHWGWPARNISANPFLSNAAVESQPRWLTGYDSDLKKIVAKVSGA
jgi:hypothetical protein